MFDRQSQHHRREGRGSEAAIATPGKRTHAEQLEPEALAEPVPGASPASANPRADPTRPTLTSLFGRAERGALPAAIQRDAESIVGTSLADVRVHESAHATSLGAHAYARGKDVVFAPGRYDTTSRAGLSLLGHELAHVAQQGRGSIAGAQARRGGIASDDALESAADRAGDQLAALATPTATRAEALASSGAATDQLVQAKLGFELESVNNRMTRLARRETAYNDADLKIEADTDGAIEFVSQPKDTVDELIGVVERARGLAKILEAAVAQPTTVPGGLSSTPRAMGLEVPDASWHVKPQQTVGLELQQLPRYLAQRSPGPAPDQRATRQHSHRRETFATTDAKTLAARQFDALIGLVVYYVQSFNGSRIGDEKEGPKSVLTFMLRNSFYDLYHSIEGSAEEDNQAAFRAAVHAQLGPKHTHVFPNGYRMDRQRVTTPKEGALPGQIQGGLTIDDWITQIFEGMERKKVYEPGTEHVATDGVSPPVPEPHRDQVRGERVKQTVYGMGAYEMDGNRALVEQRGQVAMQLMGTTEIEEWLRTLERHVNAAVTPQPEQTGRARQAPSASPFEAAVASLVAQPKKGEAQPKKGEAQPKKEKVQARPERKLKAEAAPKKRPSPTAVDEPAAKKPKPAPVESNERPAGAPHWEQRILDDDYQPGGLGEGLGYPGLPSLGLDDPMSYDPLGDDLPGHGFGGYASNDYGQPPLPMPPGNSWNEEGLGDPFDPSNLWI